jgi:sec-independent protein translocase protein TatB
MFDLGWTELLVIGIVALIVVGPKDLPVLFRNVGQFVGKAKGMAREFSSAMNDAADSSGMKEMSQGINKSIKAATNPIGTAMDGVKSATSSLTEGLDPNSETGKMAAQKVENFKKIQASSARSAAERKQREASEALARANALEAEMTPAAKPAVAKKPAPKKPVAKKAAAKKTAGPAKGAEKAATPKAKKE